MTDERRPPLRPGLSGAELLRWYWLKDELADFARSLGVRAVGGKSVLTERLAAHLDGQPFVEPEPRRAAGGRQLAGTPTAATVIPAGQRCSQVVRAWFTDQVGSSFAFDAQMRGFFDRTDGTQTMQDALDHYLATRAPTAKPIDAQFEYNRFTRAWHQEHPASGRDDLLRAWREYRDRPVDERGRA